MGDASITYFPVGNGDTILIQLVSGKSIILDCNISKDSQDEEVKSSFDVQSYLLRTLKKDASNAYHADVFILSHPDQDHCRGFDDVFYTGDPAKYSDTHKKNSLIIIDEIWFSPRVFLPHEKTLCDPAKAFRKEVNRRIELYKNKGAGYKLKGNRIRVIGFSDSDKLDGLQDIVIAPGNSISFINGSDESDFSFFVHAPFKKDTDSKWSERNDTSIVLQARFDVDNTKHACLVFMGGDAGAAIWEDILDRSSNADLKWDIFLAPHHCSWTFFSEEPYKDNKTPSDKSLQILGKKRKGAIVVSSCKPIKRNDDNPPHYAAANLYKKSVGDDKFYVTSEHPDVKQPLPIVFSMSKNGPVKEDSSKSSAIVSSAAISDVIGAPQSYGK